MQDELDSKLQALFAQSTPELRDEAFVARTLARIETEQRRSVLLKRLLQGLVVIGVAAASPALITGSAWLVRGMEFLFGVTNGALTTTTGAVVATTVSIAVVALNRKRILN